MTSNDVRRLALVLAIQAELEGMKAENVGRWQDGHGNAYGGEDFQCKVDELRNIAYKDDTEL